MKTDISTYWHITAWHVKETMDDEDYFFGTDKPIFNEKDAKRQYRYWAKKYDNVTLTKFVNKQSIVMTTRKENNETGIL